MSDQQIDFEGFVFFFIDIHTSINIITTYIGIFDAVCSNEYRTLIQNVQYQENEIQKVNANDILCELDPPTIKECDIMPVCDINMNENSHGFCSPLNVHSSCLPGFLFYNDKNVSEYQQVTFESLAMDGWNSLKCLNEISHISRDNGTNYRQKCKEYCFRNTRACCPGYYCPPGINCMIKCQSKGSYCPSSDSLSISKNCNPFNIPVFGTTMGCGGALTGIISLSLIFIYKIYQLFIYMFQN